MQTQTHTERMRALITEEEALLLKDASDLLSALHERLFDIELHVGGWNMWETTYIGVGRERCEVARQAMFSVRLSFGVHDYGEEE